MLIFTGKARCPEGMEEHPAIPGFSPLWCLHPWIAAGCQCEDILFVSVAMLVHSFRFQPRWSQKSPRGLNIASESDVIEKGLTVFVARDAGKSLTQKMQ